MHVNRKAADAKVIHVLSSGLKAMFSWHNLRSLQVLIFHSTLIHVLIRDLLHEMETKREEAVFAQTQVVLGSISVC